MFSCNRQETEFREVQPLTCGHTAGELTLLGPPPGQSDSGLQGLSSGSDPQGRELSEVLASCGALGLGLGCIVEMKNSDSRLPLVCDFHGQA